MNLVSRRGFIGLLVLLLAGLPANVYRTTAETRAQATPVTSHPRLWITAEDLPRLRGWATDANPMWRDGLLVVAEQAKADMDAGTVPGEDTGGRQWEPYPTESYAELFAFLSLVHADEAARQDYAQRARTLLMYAMNEAVKGPAAGERFRGPDFVAPDSNRLRWWGEAWALTVNWIYLELSTEDKATIRAVFLRWADEIVTLGYNHPEPIGLTNDPALYADPRALRWSGNNYFTSHMRNVGLMALALDAEDDPGGELRAYLETAIGAHLYMTDHLLRTDSSGGLAPEGFEYSPQTLAYVVQFLLALHTAGEADPARWGPQVVLTDNPFWDEVIPGFLHSLSPQTFLIPGYEYYGPVYLPAWYGDGEVYVGPDMIGLLGALGRYDDLTGDIERLDAIRWIETHTPPGGGPMLISERVVFAGGLGSLVNAILYFLIFDPAAPAPADPRPSLPQTHFAPGIGHLLARTGWDEDAAWFTYALGWIAIDHQFGDGNSFAFYRDGEWLTKGLVGYGGEFGDEDPTDDYYFPSSDHQNTLALENDPPYSNVPTDYRSQLYQRGSQWEYVPAGDPTILALSVAPGYAYALGDATNLYNSTDEGSTAILHASRSIVWLAPDTIVVYDRAASKTDGRFKRFWLNLPADAMVNGARTTMTTASGQQLVVDTLLPTGSTPQVSPLDAPLDALAIGEPMRYRLLVEAPGNPRETRFLNVLQGADAGTNVRSSVSLESADGTFAGTVVGTTAVLFPVDLGAEAGEVRYTVPAETTSHLITGLMPDGGYDVVTNPVGEGIEVTVTTGTGYQADDGGVLLVGTLPEVLGSSSLAFTNTSAPTAPTTHQETTADGPAATVSPETETASPAPTTGTVVEGGAAAGGSGQIVYEAADPSTETRHLYRVAANEGATPEDVSVALDALDPTAPDDWIGISPDGAWLLLGTERFDPGCAGWPCLAVVPADLSAGEAVRIGDAAVHPEGFGAIANGGDLIVYPVSGGPHALDLWAIARQGEGWSEPLLLTGDSPYAFHHTAAFAADGARVVFDCGDQPYAEEGTAICEVAIDGSGFRVVLTPADAPPGVTPGGALHHPDYAPDGGIVFQSRWTDTIWRLSPDAEQPEPVAPAFASDGSPCVLADGRIASVWLGRPGGEGMLELKVMTPDGTAYVMLVTGINVEDIGCGG